jgi:S1-C subfamily serine protease
MNWKNYALAGLSLFLGFSVGAYYTHYLIDQKWQNFAPFQYQKNTYAVNLENQVDFTEGSELALQSTVSIKAWKTHQKESTGAGVIFNTQGYIITNYHVIKSTKLIEVELYNQVKLEGKLIGYDEYSDLAVIKIQTDIPLKPIVFSNSDHLKVGQWVLAIGCPFHLHSTVTKGIVSGLGRDIGVLKNQLDNQEFSDLIIESFIQTDAPINPGNSGGPLVNLKGEMVGINTAIASESGYFEGFSFSIPSNLVLKVVKDIITFGKVNRSFLGITAQNTNNPFFYKRMNTNGLEISSVSLNSPAFHAGLMEGDIILAINDLKLKNFPDLKQKIATLSPNETVNLRIFRNDQVISVKVLLKSLNSYLDLEN